jgi:hypothetical protein
MSKVCPRFEVLEIVISQNIMHENTTVHIDVILVYALS